MVADLAHVYHPSIGAQILLSRWPSATDDYTVTQIAEITLSDRSHTYRLVEGLERAGLIEQVYGKLRVRRYRITRAGLLQLATWRRAVREMERKKAGAVAG